MSNENIKAPWPLVIAYEIEQLRREVKKIDQQTDEALEKIATQYLVTTEGIETLLAEDMARTEALTRRARVYSLLKIMEEEEGAEPEPENGNDEEG